MLSLDVLRKFWGVIMQMCWDDHLQITDSALGVNIARFSQAAYAKRRTPVHELSDPCLMV
jgi:hypothetical protein